MDTARVYGRVQRPCTTRYTDGVKFGVEEWTEAPSVQR